MLYMVWPGGTPPVPQLVLQTGMNEKHCMHVMTGGNSSRTTAGAPNWDEKWKALIRKSSKNLRQNFLSEMMLMNQTKVGPANRKRGWAVKSCRELPNEKIHLAATSMIDFMSWNFRKNPAIPIFLWLKYQTNLVVNNISDLHWSLAIEWQITIKIRYHSKGRKEQQS